MWTKFNYRDFEEGFNVECDKSIVEAVKTAIKQFGGKIS